MDKSREKAGMTRPKRYMNLSEVITSWNAENQETTQASMVPEPIPYKIDSRVIGFPLSR